MAYCYATIAEGAPSIEESIGIKKAAQLSGDTDGRTIDSVWLAERIAEAQAEVDGYCGKHYTVPFDTADPETAPALVSQITLDIAIYNAYKKRGAGTAPEVRQNYEDAVKKLTDIANGKIKLDVTDAEAVPSVAPATGFTAKERLFTR